MATLNDGIPLRAIGGPKDGAELTGRPHDIATGAVNVGIYRGERYAAESNSINVAG